MQDLNQAFTLATELVINFDPALYEIIGLSLKVSLIALLIASVIGLPLGAAVAITRFPGRSFVLILMNAMLGLPPVVVGLFVYLYLSNSGPLGWLQLLYKYAEQMQSLCLSRRQQMVTLLIDARFSLLTVALAGFGRAIAEVGAVIIVGGNINHLTRVMTTAIALETSKGDLPLALALGFILLVISLLINALVMTLKLSATKHAYA